MATLSRLNESHVSKPSTPPEWMTRATTILSLKILNLLLPPERQLLSVPRGDTERSSYTLSETAGSFLDIVCLILSFSAIPRSDCSRSSSLSPANGDGSTLSIMPSSLSGEENFQARLCPPRHWHYTLQILSSPILRKLFKACFSVPLIYWNAQK